MPSNNSIFLIYEAAHLHKWNSNTQYWVKLRNYFHHQKLCAYLSSISVEVCWEFGKLLTYYFPSCLGCLCHHAINEIQMLFLFCSQTTTFICNRVPQFRNFWIKRVTFSISNAHILIILRVNLIILGANGGLEFVLMK